MGRFRLFVGAVVCVLSAFAAAPGFAQFQSSFSLAGTVFADVGDRRIANAAVVLFDGEGTRLQETVSGDAGEFSFHGLRAARYVLKVHAEGFETAETGVDLTLNSVHGLSIALKVLRQPGSAIPDRPSISAHELSMPEPARELMSSGLNKLYAQNNPQGAMNDFQAAIAKEPGFYEAIFYCGLADLAMHKEADAETQFRKSFEVSQKKYGDAEIALATLLLRKGQTAEGETLLRQGLLLNPHSWPGQVELGKLELARGHIEAALAAAEIAESLAPGQPMVYRLLTAIHLQQKNYTAAISDLDSYIRLDPDSPAGQRAKELRAQAAQQLSAAASAGN